MHRILISRLLNSCILSLPRFLLHILLFLLLPCSLLVLIYIDYIILIIEISGIKRGLPGNGSETMFVPATNMVGEMFGVFVIRCTSRIEGDVTVAYMID